MAELAEFGFDPAIALSRILASEPANQLLGFGGNRSPAAATPPAKGQPLASDQLPVPAQDRVRGHEQRAPRWSGEATGEGGKDQTVPRLPASLPGGALEHVHLMTQDEDLDLAVTFVFGQEDV